MLHHSRWTKRSIERNAKRGIRVARQNNNSQPAGGDVWPVAIYWAFLKVGSNRQKFPVAIDSGSYTLNIPQVGCQGCTSQAPNAFYNPSNSTSSHAYTCSLFKQCQLENAGCQDKKCVWSNSYETCVPTDPTQTCTITGNWFQDVVSWGTSKAVKVQFGAITTQTSNFEQFQTIDGVVGMAGSANPQSVISQLANGRAIPNWLWSICLRPGSISNGTITIGGIDTRLYNGQIQYTPDVGMGQFYEMSVTGMTIGSSSVFLDESQVIIDSGTNIILLPTESYTSMKSRLLSMCSAGANLHGICDVSSSNTLFDNACFSFSQAQLSAFPNITLSVVGINLVMQPKDYLLLNYGVNGQPGQYCLGISPTGQQGLFIIGDTMMQNYYVIFDQTNQQIGWAPVSSTCGNIRGV